MTKCTQQDIREMVENAMALPNVNDITCHTGYYKLAWQDDDDNLCIVATINKWNADNNDTFDIYYAYDNYLDCVWSEWTSCDQTDYELEYALTELVNSINETDFKEGEDVLQERL